MYTKLPGQASKKKEKDEEKDGYDYSANAARGKWVKDKMSGMWKKSKAKRRVKARIKRGGGGGGFERGRGIRKYMTPRR